MKPYYDEGGITIYHGDCREVLTSIDGVALAFTSPPYDNARDYAQVTLDDLEAVGAGILRALIPGGVSAWVIDGPVNERSRSTTPFEMVCRWARLDGWRFLECLIFARMGLPGAFAGRFRKDHEYMPVFVKDGAEHICDKRALAKPSLSSWRGHLTLARRRDGGQDARTASGWAVENEMKMPGTVWEYGRNVYGHDASYYFDHPAVFPETLARDAILCFSIPNAVVIDPFAGSGTTLRAAKDLGRRAIGIEIEERYCEIAARRLAQGVLDFYGG